MSDSPVPLRIWHLIPHEIRKMKSHVAPPPKYCHSCTWTPARWTYMPSITRGSDRSILSQDTCRPNGVIPRFAFFLEALEVYFFQVLGVFFCLHGLWSWSFGDLVQKTQCTVCSLSISPSAWAGTQQPSSLIGMNTNQPSKVYTTADPTATPNTPEDGSSASAVSKPSMRRWSALESLSQWFWSAWTISNSETHGSLVEAFDAVDNSYLFAPSTDEEDGRCCAPVQEQCQVSPSDKHAHVDCKMCRSHGISCDGRRPRCSHCLEQQVLCFYVTTAPRKSRRTRSKSSHLALERAQIEAS